MKKLIASILTLLASGAAYALPVGNPTEASLMCNGIICEGCCGDPCDPCLNLWNMWSLRIGFYGDYVFNRNLEINRQEDDSDIEDSEIFTNAGFLALNFCNRLDLFTVLGASNICMRTPSSAFAIVAQPNSTDHFRTRTGFAWSVGARGTIWECGCFGVGIEGQYFSTSPVVDYLRGEGELTSYLPGNVRAKYREWQVGFGPSYRINIACSSTALVPYAAIKWSRAHVRMGNALVFLPEARDPSSRLYNLRSDKNWGYAVGVTLVGCDKGAVTVEGRFADEKGLYVNGQFRF